MYIPHDAAKHGCDHHDAVKRIEIRLRTRQHAIPKSRLEAEHIIKGTFVCDVPTKVAKNVVVELAIHAFKNIFKFLLQIFVALQTIPFLDSELVMWLYDLLRPCS